MGTVLVVDDQRDTCRLLVALLRYAGHEASWADSGPGALSHLRANPVGLVLLDYMMPAMNGFDVLRALRSDPRYDRLNVLMYSAVSDPVVREQAVRLGAQGWVVKGTDWQELQALVERHAGSAA